MSTTGASYRVAKGIKFLNENVPGWFDRMRRVGFIDMLAPEYCALGAASFGQVINGCKCYSAGDVCRATGIDGAPEGFYDDEKNGVTYADLHAVWTEVISNPSPPRGYREAQIRRNTPPLTFCDVVRLAFSPGKLFAP